MRSKHISLMVSEEELLRAIAQFFHNSTIDNFNSVLKKFQYTYTWPYVPCKTETHVPAFVFSPIRKETLEKMPSIVTPIYETYFCKFYLSILEKYLGNQSFNINIVDIINYLYELRTELKADYRINGKESSLDHQYHVKFFLNSIYGKINQDGCLLMSFLDAKGIISSIGKSIMSSIMSDIKRFYGDLTEILYFDTDEVVALENMSRFFENYGIQYHTEVHRGIKFTRPGNIKSKVFIK